MQAEITTDRRTYALCPSCGRHYDAGERLCSSCTYSLWPGSSRKHPVQLWLVVSRKDGKQFIPPGMPLGTP